MTDPQRYLPMPLRYAAITIAFALTGCIDDDRLFTQGRLEDPCNNAIPICNTQAGCTVHNDSFYAGEFPGGLRFIVRSEAEENTLITRFLLDDMIFPGTEMLVEVKTPDCGDFDAAHETNRDLFALSGDDRVIEFILDMPGRGDHLLEVFSDMSATYQMTTTVEAK